MKQVFRFFAGAGAFLAGLCLAINALTAQQTVNAQQAMQKPLTSAEKRVIVDKGTEPPFSGKYCNFSEKGIYTCRQCGAPLYRSSDKFDSGCGWPAFDDQIGSAVRRIPDPDGQRTEIVCAKCGAHLGHVFSGEGFTAKNTRYCVNSISMVFVPADTATTTPGNAATPRAIETAIFAGGCFWGVEYMMQKLPGVASTEVGYTGGHTANPTYEQVCSHRTGHAEAVRVLFDPAVVSYETVAKRFFEIHDPTQVDRQGPDIGDQYRSEIFFTFEAQKATAEKLIGILRAKGYNVATRLAPAGEFYPAEQYHQDYYLRKGTQPYCHAYTERF